VNLTWLSDCKSERAVVDGLKRLSNFVGKIKSFIFTQAYSGLQLKVNVD